MLRILWTVHKTNVSILNEIGNPRRLSSIVMKRALTFFEHIYRKDSMDKLVEQDYLVDDEGDLQHAGWMWQRSKQVFRTDFWSDH